MTESGNADIWTSNTRRQAIVSKEQEKWLAVEQKEIDYITKKEVLEPAVLLSGKNLLKTKWVYKLKHGAEGELKSFKVRLVACLWLCTSVRC